MQRNQFEILTVSECTITYLLYALRNGDMIQAYTAMESRLLNVFYPGVLNLDPVGGVSAEGDEYSITDVNRVYSVTAT